MIELRRTRVDGLGAVDAALREWQADDAPVQFHPGDLGWNGQFGAEATAEAVRLWVDGDTFVAVAFLDSPSVVRLTVAPAARQDDGFARRLLRDLEEHVLPTGAVAVESPNGTAIQRALDANGWATGESWTPLRRDLAGPVEEPAIRVEVVDGAAAVSAYTAVHRSAFGSPRFTNERWRAMAAGPAFAHARSLLGLDGVGTPVAEVTVWSAGEGRPGLLEPMGVHADHRGRGYGRAICLAAAAELRRMGASSALVCTQTALTGAIATYVASGYARMPERLDRTRER